MTYRRSFFILAVFALAPTRLTAQSPMDSTRLPAAMRLRRSEEIALALSAGPASVADSAEVWVLGDTGFEKARAGTNGYGCIVQRALGGQSLIPRCDDSSGVAALFPVYQMIESMRAEGRTYGEAKAAIAEGFRTGRLKTPRFGGLSYMYSVDGYFAMPTGQRIKFTPHVMVYWPNCSTKLLGMSSARGMVGTGLGFIDYGTPECVLVINTPTNTERHVAGEHKHP